MTSATDAGKTSIPVLLSKGKAALGAPRVDFTGYRSTSQDTMAGPLRPASSAPDGHTREEILARRRALQVKTLLARRHYNRGITQDDRSGAETLETVASLARHFVPF